MKEKEKSFRDEVKEVLDDVEAMICQKNYLYDDSALSPVRIFSHEADPEEQLRVRMDDKLSRIRRQSMDDTEDSEKDLMGYLVLLSIARKRRLAATKEAA